MKPAARQSNFELLRIVAMSMIVIHHLLVHGIGLNNILSPSVFSAGTRGGVLMVESLLIIGVNLFVLISGYFKIKLTWKAILKLGFMLIFYKTIFILADLVYSYWTNCIIPPTELLLPYLRLFSDPYYWFIGCYFALMLISPILNSALNTFSIVQMRQCIFLLTVFTCYSGFVWGNTNGNGYNTAHFVYLYILGNYLSREHFFRKIRAGIYIAIYMILSIIAVFGHEFFYRNDLNSLIWRWFNYNNPFVLLTSVCFFLSFQHIRLQSKRINAIAGSMLAVYLVHENRYVSEFLYPFIESQFNSMGLSLKFIGLLCLVFVSIFVSALLLDQLRKRVCTPLINRIVSLIPVKYQLSFNESN